MKIIFPLAFSILLSGCIREFDKTHEGSVSQYSEKAIKEKLIQGVSTKRDVLALLGRPNIPFDYNQGNEWIYTSQTKDRGIYIFIPISLDEKISLKLKFDDKKVLSNVDYSKDKG